MIIDDVIDANKNSENYADVVNSVNNESCLANDNESFFAEKIKVDKVERLNSLKVDKVDKVESLKVVKPKVNTIENLKFVKGLPSVSIAQLSYDCKIVGDKNNKKKCFFKINAFSNSVRVEVIDEDSVAIPTHTTNSTRVSPGFVTLIKLTVPYTKQDLVPVLRDQDLLG